jgi:hypothetical protein
MADNSTDTVLITTSVIGGAGFGLVDKTSGSYCIEGVKQADGSYPIIINLGVNNDGADRLTYGKAIFNFEGSSSLFRNLTVRGAEVSAGNGGNGAGFRVNDTCPRNTGSNFQAIGNQNGLLADGSADQELFYSDYVLDKNGFGREGYTHNAYIGFCRKVTFLRGEHLNSPHGHDMKSRSLHTVVQQTRCSGSAQGRELDLSNGGIWESSHSEYIKPAIGRDGQNNLIHIAPEGIPDARPERYTSINDLFQIDNAPDGRGFEFIKNEGRVECVLTDPKFVLGGKVLTDEEARPYLIGNIRIIDTGGKRGPLLPVGCAGDIKAGGTAPAPFDLPAPAPAPTPASAPAPVPAAGAWMQIGGEGDTLIVDAGTTVRYGANGAYVTKVVSGAFTASNSFFGNDPAYGIQKVVEKYVGVVTPAPVPTPAPTPIPTPTPEPAPVPAPVDATTLVDALIVGFVAALEAAGYSVTKK